MGLEMKRRGRVALKAAEVDADAEAAVFEMKVSTAIIIVL
jgi:hypothetical protein